MQGPVGWRVAPADAALAAARHARRLYGAQDPAGNSVELFSGLAQSSEAFASEAFPGGFGTFSFYGATPSGFDFEIGAGSQEIDPAHWDFMKTSVTSSWGHTPQWRLQLRTAVALTRSWRFQASSAIASPMRTAPAGAHAGLKRTTFFSNSITTVEPSRKRPISSPCCSRMFWSS